MKKYELKLTSSFSFIGVLILSIIGFLVLGIGALEIHKSMYEIPFLVIWGIGTWYAIKRGASGKAKVLLTKDTLEIKWLKKPFSSLQRSKKVHFSEITGWRYRPDREFDMLKIYFQNDEDIRLEKRIPLFQELRELMKEPEYFINKEPEDFYKLKNDINSIVDQENERRKQTNAGKDKNQNGKVEQNKIVDKEAEFYRGYKGKTMYYFGIAMCVAIGVLLLFSFSGKLDLSTVFGLISALSGAVFYILTYRKKHKRYTSEDETDVLK